MKIYSAMVTGANRGIGLEFVRQLAAFSDPPEFVFATYRNADGLQNLKLIEESSTKCQIILIKMDVTHPEEVELAKQIVESKVGDRGLTLLVNNAGVAKLLEFPNVTAENMEEHFRVNTVGPLMLFQAMFPLLEKAAAQDSRGGAGMSFSKAGVLNITSMAGSIFNTGHTFTQDLVVLGYKTSKAALNMCMRVAAAKAKSSGIMVLLMCPGYVRTDMTEAMGEIEVDQSVQDMLTTLPMLDENSHGFFMDRLGNRYPF